MAIQEKTSGTHSSTIGLSMDHFRAESPRKNSSEIPCQLVRPFSQSTKLQSACRFVLANRPGFPFLGNDLLREADAWHVPLCHAIGFVSFQKLSI